MNSNISIESVARNYVNLMANEESYEKVLDYRTEQTKEFRKMLFLRGKIWSELVQSEGNNRNDLEEKTINQALDLNECFLTGVECALIKYVYVKDLLDPNNNSMELQNRLPLVQDAEWIFLTQRIRASEIIRKNPDILRFMFKQENPFTTVLLPWNNMCFKRSETESSETEKV